MGNWIFQNPAFVFLLGVAGLWIAISTVLAFSSEWSRLTASFPDRPEKPLLWIPGQSGWIGQGVGVRGLLTLSACPSGLRVGISRLFAPFCRDFFVPWEALSVARRKMAFISAAELQFGHPQVGTVTVSSWVANRLAGAASGRWPEPGPFPVEARHNTVWRHATQWALITAIAAVFFSLPPLIFGPPGARPAPLAIAILFPAVVFGAITVLRYFSERN